MAAWWPIEGVGAQPGQLDSHTIGRGLPRGGRVVIVVAAVLVES